MTRHGWILGLLFGFVGATSAACEPKSDGNDEGGDDGTGGGGNGGGGGGGDDSGRGGSREAQICQRAAECLYLEAGYTVGDCTDIVESCTANLLTSEQLDWNGWADDCLGLNNCMNFGACYLAIDVCTLYVEVEVVDETAAPPSDDDGDGGDDGPPDPTDGDSGPPDPSGGGGCGPDGQACLDDWTLAECSAGVTYLYDCLEECLNGGYSDTLGCAYDPVAGVDMCFCQ